MPGPNFFNKIDSQGASICKYRAQGSVGISFNLVFWPISITLFPNLTVVTCYHLCHRYPTSFTPGQTQHPSWTSPLFSGSFSGKAVFTHQGQNSQNAFVHSLI